MNLSGLLLLRVSDSLLDISLSQLPLSPSNESLFHLLGVCVCVCDEERDEDEEIFLRKISDNQAFPLQMEALFTLSFPS